LIVNLVSSKDFQVLYLLHGATVSELDLFCQLLLDLEFAAGGKSLQSFNIWLSRALRWGKSLQSLECCNCGPGLTVKYSTVGVLEANPWMGSKCKLHGFNGFAEFRLSGLNFTWDAPSEVCWTHG
jgi:hypothetical protein